MKYELFATPAYGIGNKWPEAALRAMACGTRVVAVRAPSLTDVLGDGALYAERAL